MQNPTDGPRSGYTTNEVAYLIEQAPSVTFDFGVEVISLDLVVDSDISEDVSGCTVSRNSTDPIHGSASFALSVPLDWGNSIVRPYLLMTGPISSTATTLTTMQFYLGAYFIDTPEEDLSQSPSTFDATGYDILSILDDPVGGPYSVDTGENPLARVEEILQNRGITQYVIDQDSAVKLVVSPMVWTLADNPTWLTIVNALLKYVGYGDIYTDWNGLFRCDAYVAATLRPVEWVMTADVDTAILTQRRRRQHDFYATPNRWVFYRSGQTDEAAPTEGAGMYTFVNETVGDASVEARGGRTITKVESVDAADQAALVAAAQKVIDTDMQIPTRFTVETAPFALAWHQDVYEVRDPTLGAALKVQAVSWQLDLSGKDQSHEWSSIDAT